MSSFPLKIMRAGSAASPPVSGCARNACGAFPLPPCTNFKMYFPRGTYSPSRSSPSSWGFVIFRRVQQPIRWGSTTVSSSPSRFLSLHR